MVVGSPFFILGRNPPTLFEPIDQPLDRTAQSVQVPGKRLRSLLIVFPGQWVFRPRR